MESEVVKGPRACARCGEPVKSLSTGGICPACLVEVMLLPAEDGSDQDEPAGLGGRIFGDYELIDEIGRGGMGLIYRARQRKLNRLVALKILSGGIFAGAEAVRRFRTEAELAASLEHANIVRILEIGEHDGHEFFSMSLVEGPSMSEIVGSLGMGARPAAELVAKIARAVQFAHDRGILHRDLKPNNILLQTNLEPCLTDFGIAKVIEQDSTLTRTNSILGTPAYMAPEQARGDHKNLTVATDVYGLGAVLYYCLTGSAPFGGGTTFETVRQLLEQEPRPPALIDPKIDSDLSAICLKCLEKEAARRYPSASALAAELEAWLNGEPILAKPASGVTKTWKWFRRRPAIAGLSAAVLGVAVLGLVGVLWQWHQAEIGRAAAVRAEGQAMRENYFASIALAQRYLDDGDFARARRLLVSLPENLRDWEWGRLVFLCFQEITSIPLMANAVPNIAWTPDGRQIIARDGERLQAWSFPEGIEQFHWDERITRELHFPQASRAPTEFLPGIVHRAEDAIGDRFAVLYESGRIELARSNDPNDRREMPAPERPYRRIALSPDGNALAGLGGDFSLRVWDTRSLREILHYTERAYTCAFSPGGRLIAVWGGDPVVSVVEIDTGEEIAQLYGGELTAATASSADGMGMAFSPDGRYLALANPGAEIKIYEVQNARERFKFSSGFRKNAVSRDGSRLAAAHPGGRVTLWDLDRGQLLTETLGNLQWCLNLAFAPAENRLATCGADKATRVWDLDLSSEQLILPHAAAVFTCAWDNTGTRLITSDATGVVTLWDSHSGTQLAATNFGHEVVLALAVSASNTLAAACADGTVLLSALDFRNTRTVGRHADSASAALFRSDGGVLMTGGFDRLVRAWDLKTGGEIASALAAGPVFGLSFNSAATRLAIASSGRLTGLQNPSIQLLEAAALREIVTFKYPPGQITAVNFTPDGARIVAGLVASGFESHFGFQLPSLPLRDRDYAASPGANLAQQIRRFAREQLQARVRAERNAAPLEIPAVSRIPMDWPARPSDAPLACLDLTRNYNAWLTFPWRPLSRWSEFSDDLASFRAGLLTNGSIVFDARGLIVAPPDESGWNQIPLYTKPVAPVQVARRGMEIHFLHATTFPATAGEHVGEYVAEWENGSTQSIPLRFGIEISCWASQDREERLCANAVEAWRSSAQMGRSAVRRLFHYAWVNPRPETAIKQISLRSHSPAAPFLVAMTIAPHQTTPPMKPSAAESYQTRGTE